MSPLGLIQDAGLISAHTWNTLLWSGVILCAVAPFIYIVCRFLYQLRKPEKSNIKAEMRREKLNEAQSEFEARKRQREEAMKRFEEKHKH